MFIRGRNTYAAESYKRTRSYASSNDYRGVRWFFGTLIFIAAVAFACVVPQLIPVSVATNTAHGLGFTNVKVVSREWLFIQFTGCDKADSVKFTVSGTNAAGHSQTFYVCAGLFKAGTPRFP